MKIVDLSQHGDEWLTWRNKGITATDAVVLLGLSPHKTIWRLWAEKTGYMRPVDLSLNPLVRQGIELEPIARMAFEDYIQDLCIPACVEASANPLFRASLDGLTSANEPVEIKCPSKKTWLDVKKNREQSTAYKMYSAQVQHQLLVTGSKKGYLVFYFEDELEVFIIHVDKDLLKKLLPLALSFHQSVIDKKEPEKDPEKDLYVPQGDEANQWIYFAEKYKTYEDEASRLKARLKELDELKKPLLENLQGLMGEYYHADYCGLLVTRYDVSGRINYEQYLKDHGKYDPDLLESYRGKKSTRCRVTVSDNVLPRHLADKEAIEALEQIKSMSESKMYF